MEPSGMDDAAEARDAETDTADTADIADTTDETDETDDLFEAVHGDDVDAVVAHLRARRDAGADADAADTDGRTVLYTAAVSGRAGIVRVLLAAGASPDRLSSGTDLALCGAACNGHTDTVEALLAAGATPDAAEEHGMTALAWAVQLGHADVVELLLAAGAHPDLAAPGGQSPLILAARRGSLETVRALLRHDAGARREALDEALLWAGKDIVRELRRALAQSYEGVDERDEDGQERRGATTSEGTGPAFETVVREVPKDGGFTVVVELLDDGEPFTGTEQETSHAAVATLLEAELGIRAPFEELGARALRRGVPEHDDWVEAVVTLRARGDESTFRSAAAWCRTPSDPLRTLFAADVLGQLGTGAGSVDLDLATEETGGGPAEGALSPRVVPLLRELAREAVDPELIGSVVLGLGHHGDPAALPELLSFATYPDAAVRECVAQALLGLVPGGHPEGTAALIALSGDEDPYVRDWATTALATLDSDAPEVRDVLVARLDDPRPDTAAEAALGLARRDDPRAVDALARLLERLPQESAARAVVVGAVSLLPDADARRRLGHILPFDG